MTTTTFKPMTLQETLNSYDWLCQAEHNVEFVKRNSSWCSETVEEAQKKFDNAKDFWHTDSLELADVIKTAQGKARSRTITPEDIMEALNTVDSHLKLSRTAMKGVTVTVNYHAQHFPNAYRNKGVPESTYFEAEYTRNGWRLTNIYRDVCRATTYSVHLTDEAKAAIIRNAESF